ncbi:methyltransferase domain-containing protein [Paenibacillus sp. GCM10023252]|uniref:methyltransferase domain-containing protein n=1 Tax=Paenibacillus sp. GCM10023252 TaxID=3252649 RepID=UPI003622813C
MERLMAKEWLDEEEAVEPAELERSLGEVWNVNRYLGGNPALFTHLRRMLLELHHSGRTSRIRMLDVATGLADIPLAVHKWCHARRIKVEIVGADLHPRIVELASRRTKGVEGVSIVQADGTCLPYGEDSFDIVFSNLALHHMTDEEAVLMLAEINRVARSGWVVTDLERHPLAYRAAQLLARFVWRSPVTKHDGPMSVLRSFTAAEARLLAKEVGGEVKVHRHFPYRLALVHRARA